MNRRHVHDDARALRDHRRQEGTIEAHGGHQVDIELLSPCVVVEGCEASRRRRGAANDVDDDVDPAEDLQGHLRNQRTALSRREVCGNELRA